MNNRYTGFGMSNQYTGFGYWKACPPDISIAWGARAIYSRGTIDLLYDRQSWNGTDKDDFKVRRGLGKRIDLCLPALEQEVKRLYNECVMYADKEEEFTFDTDELRFVFNTNGSCGYLYILAYDVSWVK